MIERVPYPNSLPIEQQDYVKQNNLIETGFLNVNKPAWTDGSNILLGVVFQVGGTVYLTTSNTAIAGVSSDYIKLTPSVDGSTLSPAYVADLTGVSWNNTYNGYYDISGNLYIFDEYKALIAGELADVNIRLWKAIKTFLTVNNTFTGENIFNADTTLQYSATSGAGVEIKQQSGAGSKDFEIKVPITCYLKLVGSGGLDSVFLYLRQNSTTYTIGSLIGAGTFYLYGLMLNPGAYRIFQSVGGIGSLICTGVYSKDSIVANEIVT